MININVFNKSGSLSHKGKHKKETQVMTIINLPKKIYIYIVA